MDRRGFFQVLLGSAVAAPLVGVAAVSKKPTTSGWIEPGPLEGTYKINAAWVGDSKEFPHIEYYQSFTVDGKDYNAQLQSLRKSLR